MSRRNPFGATLNLLRGRLADGDYAPGAPLVIGDLAQELAVSTTPVREALAWLAGERSIEERRGLGFSAWRAEPGDLVALYDLHEAYLQLALASLGARRDGAPEPDAAAGAAVGTVRRTARLFRQIVLASGSAPLLQVHGALTVRLGRARLAEVEALSDVAGELDHLDQTPWNAPALAAAVADYHRRRRARALAIVSAMAASQIY
ncbi:GntR family transcriptional regulator [Phenylobacterium sp.]|uniref:GntR family transcriptional regulator n=1 Tax=Phenylobacterium sp. TaxID=1871053 RepID=UPI0035AECDA9